MNWEECLENRIIIKTFKNLELAKSLFNTALDRKKFIENVSAKNFERFVVEGYYDVLMELKHSILSINGFKSYNHECSIEFLAEFYSKEFNKSEIKFLQRLRMLRNLIKYEGKISKEDSRHWIENSKNIFNKLTSVIRREII